MEGDEGHAPAEVNKEEGRNGEEDDEGRAADLEGKFIENRSHLRESP